MEKELDVAIQHELTMGSEGLPGGLCWVWAELWDTLEKRPVEYWQHWLWLVWAGCHPGQPIDYLEEKSGLEVWMATGRL